MAFYTPPSRPHTPAHSMAAPDLLSSWSMWPKHAPLTPPMTSTFQSRRTTRTTLPPIAHLDRHLSAIPPLTPPEDVPLPPIYSPQPSRLPPIIDHTSDALEIFQPQPSMSSGAPQVIDWLDFTRTRSAHSIAEKTCEMVCYLWFSLTPAAQPYPSPNNSPPFMPRRDFVSTSQQLVANPAFVQFIQKVLETTQVSQSVIVLSLHYIYRLRASNRFTPEPGSEFRIAVAALMMANKFLDDNTYTNKTWSEVSGIDLSDVNKMEREFLTGVQFNLYVDKPTYESWLNLLKGLVMAKERDCRQFRRSRGLVRTSKALHPHASSGPVARTYTNHRTAQPRARSTSPAQTRTLVYSYPMSHGPPANPEPSSPTPRSGSKRSAAAAFSPPSAAFSQIPSKRPVSISLQIPEYRSVNGAGPNSGHSHSPLEGLQSFATMSLASPHAPPPSHRSQANSWASGTGDLVPETLVTPYSLDEGRRTAVPQNLYFYALACSPLDTEEENRSRKAKLRYHQPPPPSVASYYSTRPAMPVVHSASTSPHDHHVHIMPHALPHFHDTQWSRPPNPSIPSFKLQQPTTRYASQKITTDNTVPSAPFANAGPPGVHFYPTPVQNSATVYPHEWSRGRRF